MFHMGPINRGQIHHGGGSDFGRLLGKEDGFVYFFPFQISSMEMKRVKDNVFPYTLRSLEWI